MHIFTQTSYIYCMLHVKATTQCVFPHLVGDQRHVAIFAKEDQQLVVRGHGELVKVPLFSTYNTKVHVGWERERER